MDSESQSWNCYLQAVIQPLAEGMSESDNVVRLKELLSGFSEELVTLVDGEVSISLQYIAS